MVQPNQTFHFKVYIYTIFANQGFEILRKRSEMVQPNQTFHFKVYIYTIFANQGFEILRKRSEMVQPNQTCHFKVYTIFSRPRVGVGRPFQTPPLQEGTWSTMVVP